MSNATGRSSGRLPAGHALKPVAAGPDPTAEPLTPGRAGGADDGSIWAAGEPPPDKVDEQVGEPPWPHIVLPSSAAAVRVKEQQLDVGSGGGEGGQEEEEYLDAVADAMAVAEQPRGPGLLQKAADAASSVAHQAVELAAGAYAAAVGQSESTEEVEGTAGPVDGQGRGGAGTSAACWQPQQMEQPMGLQRPPTASTAEHATAAAAAATVVGTDRTTAAVLPASAGTPAAAGQGYFPVVGVAAPAPKPAHRASGDDTTSLRPALGQHARQQKAFPALCILNHCVNAGTPAAAAAGVLEAHKVVAERLTGLAAEAARHTPATPAGRAARAGRSTNMEEDWISVLVERLWPYLKAAIEETAWQMLPDILEASEPSWIHDINLKTFVLGDKEPDISDICVWMDEANIMEDCFLEFAFSWHSQQDVELEIQVLPASMDKAWLPNFIEDRLKDLLTFAVGVEDVVLKGRMRITLRPLLRRMPVVGAVQVSLLDQPEFDFDLTLGDSTNVPLEPALKSWIKQTLQDSVFQTYVTPEHYFLQIDPQAADIELPAGVLVVEVVEATRVPKMDLLTRSSPFVELYVRNSQRRVTSTKSPTKHPRWAEVFELPVHVPEHQELRLVLYDYDWASANDEIGRAVVKLSDLQPGQQADLWLDMASEADKELAEQRKDMRKREHAKMAIAKTLLKQSSKNCQLHIQATYHPFNDTEEQLIKEGQRSGMRQMLDSQQGSQISPHLRTLLLSGTLHLKVPRAEDLSVSSLIGRPSIKGIVRCGGQEKELAAVKASKHGSVQFDQPVQLDLGPDATQNSNTLVRIELQEACWFGGGTVGHMHVPLQDVIKERHMQREFRLGGEGSTSRGHVQLEVEWKPCF